MSLPPAENEKKVALVDQGNGYDDAPSLVSDESFTNPTGINEKALLRRLDLKLLPPLTLLYLLSFLDRSNSMFPPLLLRGKGAHIFRSWKCEVGRLDEGFAYHRQSILVDFDHIFHWLCTFLLEWRLQGVSVNGQRSSSKSPPTSSSSAPRPNCGFPLSWSPGERSQH
jgi:hypothetical protein